MLMGFRRPVILLPEDIPAGSLEAALAHELTHLKHRDTWYMLLMTLARCVHWFNPLVWLMVRTARRDMELYCDYDLLNGQGEEVRRAYGRAILDQMTGRDRGFSGLTTGFSGSKKEVFARFRAMMDTAPKRKGRALLALAAAAIVLSGSLVACQAETQPQTWTAWVDAMDLEERTVTYTLLVDSMGEDMERTAPLAEDAQLLHTYEGEAYPLNPETLRYTQDMAQDGLVGTVELNGRGEVVRVQLNVFSQLDLTAAGLDFTGYCGEVYAAGGVGGINTVSWDEESCWVDPCNDLGQDSDYTVYMLPLAEGCTIQEGLRAYTVGLSSGNYPDLYRLTLVDGAVTAIEGVWPEAENTVTLPNDPEEETPSNPENMPEYDPDFYGENGAEDMPEYDPEFYGESGAQPLEPDGSGTA